MFGVRSRVVVATAKLDFTAEWILAHDCPQERCLTRTVEADEPGDLPARDVRVDAVQNQVPAKFDAKIPNRHQRRRRDRKRTDRKRESVDVGHFIAFARASRFARILTSYHSAFN